MKMKPTLTVTCLRVALAAVVALGALSLAPSFATEASAQSRSFSEGPPIRRQLLYRSSKLELLPSVGAMFGNSYQTPLYVGLTTRYHLTNSVAIGVDLNGSPYAVNRRYLRDLEDRDPQTFSDLAIAQTRGLGSFHIAYSPIIGKVNWFGNSVAHIDVHFFVGAAGALQTGDGDAINGFRFGGVVGMGIRMFVSDNVALNIRLSDYIYQDAEAQLGVRSAEERWRQHFLLNAGVSIFFPRAVYVSR